jgi:hypothetical protein
MCNLNAGRTAQFTVPRSLDLELKCETGEPARQTPSHWRARNNHTLSDVRRTYENAQLLIMALYCEVEALVTAPFRYHTAPIEIDTDIALAIFPITRSRTRDYDCLSLSLKPHRSQITGTRLPHL